MSKREYIDPNGQTEEQVKADADAGEFIGRTLLLSLNGLSPFIVYNVLGNMVSGVFSAIEYEQPQHALIEFDSWVKYTREHLADIIKERMQ